MRSTFKQLFYINRQKMKKNGKCPIMGRITIDGKACQYSTSYEIDPCLWNPSTGRAFASGKILEVLTPEEKMDIKRLNTQLDDLMAKGEEAYKRNLAGIGYVSAEVIKNAILDTDSQKDGLLELLADYNDEYKKRIGIDRCAASLQKFKRRLPILRDFIVIKYDRDDISVRELDYQFMVDFDFYLSTTLRMVPSTVNGFIARLHLIVRQAVKKKIIRRDPFAGFKYHKVKSNHHYLTMENLHKMMALELNTYRLCHTRDLFVFSCFTGIGRADLANLKESDIKTNKDGSQWIHIARQKTDTDCVIPLLDIPRRIIEKYKGEGKDGHVFFVPTTTCICKTLKMIEKQGNFNQHLRYYDARHTFATQVCLSNNVPIESISKMLGHTHIETTQIYAEITMQKQREDMQKLADSLDECFEDSDKRFIDAPYKVADKS